MILIPAFRLLLLSCFVFAEIPITFNDLIKNINTSYLSSEIEQQNRFSTYSNNGSIFNCSASFNSITCNYNIEPTNPSTMFIQIYGFKMSLCYMQFDKNNIHQTIHFYPQPDFGPFHSLFPFETLSTGGNNAINNIYSEMWWGVELWSQIASQPVTCQILGQVQIRTFQSMELPITFQGLGVYTILESKNALRILGLYVSCDWGNVCIQAITVQYLLAGYRISAHDEKLVFEMIGSDYSGTNYVLLQNAITIQIDDGSKILITLSGNYLGITIILSYIHYQQVSGHCNVWDHTIQNDILVDKNGTTYSNELMNTWAESFMISNNDTKNCIMGNCPQVQRSAPLFFDASLNFPQFCQIRVDGSTPLNILPPKPFIGLTPYNFTNDFKFDYLTAKKECKINPVDAQNWCSEALNGGGMACQFLSGYSITLQNCVRTVLSVCHYKMLNMYSDAYYTTCALMSEYLLTSNNASARAIGRKVNDILGIDGSCSSNCMNCGVYGCECSNISNITGFNCLLNISNAVGYPELNHYDRLLFDLDPAYLENGSVDGSVKFCLLLIVLIIISY